MLEVVLEHLLTATGRARAVEQPPTLTVTRRRPRGNAKDTSDERPESREGQLQGRRTGQAGRAAAGPPSFGSYDGGPGGGSGANEATARDQAQSGASAAAASTKRVKKVKEEAAAKAAGGGGKGGGTGGGSSSSAASKKKESKKEKDHGYFEEDAEWRPSKESWIPMETRMRMMREEIACNKNRAVVESKEEQRLQSWAAEGATTVLELERTREKCVVLARLCLCVRACDVPSCAPATCRRLLIVIPPSLSDTDHFLFLFMPGLTGTHASGSRSAGSAGSSSYA